MTTCEHMQQTGRQTELSEALLARSGEEAVQGTVRLEHANDQLRACLEAVRHCLQLSTHPVLIAERLHFSSDRQRSEEPSRENLRQWGQLLWYKLLTNPLFLQLSSMLLLPPIR